MNKLTDHQLLAAYAAQRSEAAFAELVRRHIDLVHSAALRLVRDAHTAHDVTQGVFLALAQNARQLTDRPALEGWLHGTTRNLAANAVRSDVRRRAREQEAALMNELLSADPDTRWEHIAPQLDDALGELDEPDREALLLRYFKNHDLRTVGATLGISDDAAQKRVSRAVERLRESFTKRGLTVGAGGLVVVISANAVQAAPVGLAVTISTAATLAGTTLATSATATAAKAIAMTTLQKALVTVTVAVLAGTGIYEARQASNLRSQIQTLEQQQAPLAEQIQQLTRAYNDATNRFAAVNEDNQRLNSNTAELLRLRGEVGMLRQQNTRAQTMEQENDQLRAALTNSQSTADLVTFNQQQENVNKDMKHLVLGFRQYARNHNAVTATNFDQLVSELPVTTNSSGTSLLLPNGCALTTFEFLNVGLANDTTPERLIFRERNLRRDPDGNWTRFYGFADGTAVKRTSPHGNFEDWEKQHIVQPPTKSP